MFGVIVALQGLKLIFFFLMVGGACPYYIKSFVSSLSRIYSGFSTCCSTYFCCNLSTTIWKGKYFHFWEAGKEQHSASVTEQKSLRTWTVTIISNYSFYYSASYLCLSWSCSQYLNCERDGVNCFDDIGEEQRRRRVLKITHIKIYSLLLHVIVSKTLI